MDANFRVDLSSKGLAFIARLEGFSPTWYECPAGKQTIGYGHARLGGEVIDQPITREFGLALLRRDAQHAADTVRRQVNVVLQQHEFDALTSFVFNVGGEAFQHSSLLKYLNHDMPRVAADEFEWWAHNSGGRVLPGLERRRAAEKRLFLTGEY